MTTSPSRSYQRTTTSTLAAEDAAERARRNGIDPGGPSAPLSAPRNWHREMEQDMADGPARPAPALKGAVKVGAFPARNLYPFREIADDGGIWKLEAAAYTWHGKPVKVAGLRSSASKWAIENGFKAKTVIDGGYLYVQFSKGAS